MYFQDHNPSFSSITFSFIWEALCIFLLKILTVLGAKWNIEMPLNRADLEWVINNTTTIQYLKDNDMEIKQTSQATQRTIWRNETDIINIYKNVSGMQLAQIIGF